MRTRILRFGIGYLQHATGDSDRLPCGRFLHLSFPQKFRVSIQIAHRNAAPNCLPSAPPPHFTLRPQRDHQLQLTTSSDISFCSTSFSFTTSTSPLVFHLAVLRRHVVDRLGGISFPPLSQYLSTGGNVSLSFSFSLLLSSASLRCVLLRDCCLLSRRH